MRERPDALAFRSGAMIGAADGGLGLLIFILITAFKGDPGVLLAGCVGFLATFALLVEVGQIIAKQAGTVSSGVLAGATAGFLMGAGLNTVSILQVIRGGKLHAIGQIGIILGIILTLLAFGALLAGIGAGLGALGCLVGQAGFQRARSDEMAVSDSTP